MSKIVKKKDLDVLIESTLEKAGIKGVKKPLIKEAIEEYRDENLVVTRPITHEEMCKYGSGTRWCVAHKSGSRFFDMYGGSEGNFRVYVNKKTNERVAEDLSSGRMFDQMDKEIYELPEWAKGWDTSDNLGESKKTKKPLINEEFKSELEKFNKLTNFNYKY